MENHSISLMLPQEFPLKEIMYCVEDKAVHPETHIRLRNCMEETYTSFTIQANSPLVLPFDFMIPYDYSDGQSGLSHNYLEVEVVNADQSEVYDSLKLFYRSDSGVGMQTGLRLHYKRGEETGPIPLGLTSENGHIAMWISWSEELKRDGIVVGDFVIDPDWTNYDVCTVGIPPADGLNFYFTPGSTVSVQPELFSSVEHEITIEFEDSSLDKTWGPVSTTSHPEGFHPYVIESIPDSPSGNPFGHRATLYIKDGWKDDGSIHEGSVGFTPSKIKMPVEWKNESGQIHFNVQSADGSMNNQSFNGAQVFINCS